MRLGIPVYHGVNLLDVAGPLEMFHWAGRRRRLETLIVSQDGGAVATTSGMRVEAHASFAAMPALDVLWVPGGAPDALDRLMASADSPYIHYIGQVAAAAKWVCSVSDGALLLAGAGLLDGHRATTHWAFVECLRQFPAVDVDTARQRFVVSGNRLTAGGISAGLDAALKLIALLFDVGTAEAVQVSTQYFPRPPVMGEIPPTQASPPGWN